MYLYKEQYLAALIIYVIASLTDIADGYIARRFDIVTNFGKVEILWLTSYCHFQL